MNDEKDSRSALVRAREFYRRYYAGKSAAELHAAKARQETIREEFERWRRKGIAEGDPNIADVHLWGVGHRLAIEEALEHADTLL